MPRHFDAMTERCNSIYAAMQRILNLVIYQDFNMYLELYIVVRHVTSLGDKILAKTSIHYKFFTLHKKKTFITAKSMYKTQQNRFVYIFS